MKISLSTHQFFDDEGRPLASGRITVYLHDSDTPADLYTMGGDEYVQAENPVTCYEDGRIPTLFFEASVVDVKVEKSNLDGTYELLDTYEDGFDMPSGKSDTVAEGIDSMKQISPSVGTVTVVGYSSTVMAPPRSYVWDPTCTELADDGVIVESDTTDTGRWILLWDDEKLPCTVYGIVPGDESNISAFLTFPETVGQWNIHTPRICRFLGGTYTSSTTFSTAKKLHFDANAKFTSAFFNCQSATVEHGNTSFIADMRFTDTTAGARLSWFRTRTAFRDCGAKVIDIDADYTASGNGVTVSNKVVHQFTAVPSWLTLDNVVVSIPGEGKLAADTVQATDVLRVGRLFRVVPHDINPSPGAPFESYYHIYSMGNDEYPTMTLTEASNVIFHNGIDVRAGISIPRAGHTQQWWGYFEGYSNPQIQIDAEGSIKCDTLQGNLTSTTANVGTLTVTSNAKVGKLSGRNYNFIPLFAGLNRSYTDVDLTWTSYGSHILPASIPQNARLKIHMTWAWNDSSGVAISDYIHLSGASGRSFGDCIAIQNCGPQSASFTFEDMSRGGDAETIADKCGPIYVIDMNLNLIDIIPPFATHRFMYNGGGWDKIEI